MKLDRRIILFNVIGIVLALLVGEICLRVYLGKKFNVSLLKAHEKIFYYYPEVESFNRGVFTINNLEYYQKDDKKNLERLQKLKDIGYIDGEGRINPDKGPFVKPGHVNFDESIPRDVTYMIKNYQPRKEEKSSVFKVLLFSGSALHSVFSDFDLILEKRLTEILNNEARVYNLSQPSHTSKDTEIKMSLLDLSDIDLILVYHGGNDFRANNIPDDVFRMDYSHYTWYEDINCLLAHPEMKYVVTPYVVARIGKKVLDKVQKRQYLARHNYVQEEWMDYAKNVKTVDSIRYNYTSVAKKAKKQKIPIVLMTAAYYIPKNYTKEKYEAGKLDYIEQESYQAPVEMWGKLEYVKKGMLAQNQVIRDVAANENVPMIDMERLLKKRGKFFKDLCHLSREGTEAFASVFASELLKHLPKNN